MVGRDKIELEAFWQREQSRSRLTNLSASKAENLRADNFEGFVVARAGIEPRPPFSL